MSPLNTKQINKINQKPLLEPFREDSITSNSDNIDHANISSSINYDQPKFSKQSLNLVDTISIILNSFLEHSVIGRSFIKNSNIGNSLIKNSIIENSSIQNCVIVNAYIVNSVINNNVMIKGHKYLTFEQNQNAKEGKVANLVNFYTNLNQKEEKPDKQSVSSTKNNLNNRTFNFKDLVAYWNKK